MDFANDIILVGAGLILVSIISSLFSARLGAPLLLAFLVIGMVAGESGPGGLRWRDVHSSYLLGSLALAIILFDSGLKTRLPAVRLVWAPATLLATVGVLVTAAVTGAAATLAFDFGWLPGLAFGAIVGSTDAAAVFFLLHVGRLNLKPRVSATLEVESGVNDPMAVALTIALVALAGGGQGGWTLALDFLRQMVVGGVAGLVGGLVLVRVVNRLTLASGLYPLLALSGALAVFGVAAVGGGSGFLAIYVVGQVLANRPPKALGGITRFVDGLTWLAQMVMFLMMGLLVSPPQLAQVARPALAVAMVLMLVARPLAVALCLSPFRYGRRETVFVAWVGLRGAVSILLALAPALAGLDDAALFFNAAFLVVLFSLVIQGWTIRPAARWLGLVVPTRTAPVRRFELDLPGRLDFEMVAYPIEPDSPAVARATLPAWAQLVMVVRDGTVRQAPEHGGLQAGDYAYVMAPPDKSAALDRFFARRAAMGGNDELDFFGDFTVDADASVATVAQLYGLEVGRADPQATMAELVLRAFPHPSAGDAVRLGGILLVVRDLDDDGRITQIGLKLDPHSESGGLVRLMARLWRWIDGL